MRISCLLPRKEMVDQSWRTLMENGADWQAYNITIDYGPTDYAIEWARQLEASADKPDIIIARGLQATHIKHNSRWWKSA